MNNIIEPELGSAIETNKQIKKTIKAKMIRFLALNWRIIILVLLLIASILFIMWSNSQVDENFVDTLR